LEGGVDPGVAENARENHVSREAAQAGEERDGEDGTDGGGERGVMMSRDL
jgi:hypothetical protein